MARSNRSPTVVSTLFTVAVFALCCCSGGGQEVFRTHSSVAGTE